MTTSKGGFCQNCTVVLYKGLFPATDVDPYAGWESLIKSKKEMDWNINRKRERQQNNNTKMSA